MMFTRRFKLFAVALTTTTVGCAGQMSAPEGPSVGADRPPIYEHREDSAQPRIIIGEGQDRSGWAINDTVRYLAPGLNMEQPTLPEGFSVPDNDRDWDFAEDENPERLPPHRFPDGELCTHSAQQWGSLCTDSGGAGCLRDEHYRDVFLTGMVLGTEVQFVLNSPEAMEMALPASGSIGPMRESQIDPLSTVANQIAGEVAAMRMNILFSQAGYLGTYDFSTAIVSGGPFDRWTVEAVANYGESLLGEQNIILGMEGIGYLEIFDEFQAINAAGQNCVASSFIHRAVNRE